MELTSWCSTTDPMRERLGLLKHPRESITWEQVPSWKSAFVVVNTFPRSEFPQVVGGAWGHGSLATPLLLMQVAVVPSPFGQSLWFRERISNIGDSLATLKVSDAWKLLWMGAGRSSSLTCLTIILRRRLDASVLLGVPVGISIQVNAFGKRMLSMEVSLKAGL